ncbi:MAG: FAD binding domain-containing protein [Solirubrobacteraceae bacterium]
MIPSEFQYFSPITVDEAVGLLQQHGDEAKLIAGGHSLLPAMKLRLSQPSVLVDISKIKDLKAIVVDGRVTIGAGATYRDIASSAAVQAACGVLTECVALIGDIQVRNRGTIGGSLAHGDPASDLPAVLLAAEGSVTVQGSGGEREIAAAELFQDYMTTAIAPGEVMTSVSLPSGEGWGFGYQKFNRRVEDWAMVGVCALVRKAADGSCEDVRVGLTNMGSTPLRATATEDALRGGGLDADAIARAAEQAADGTDPPPDLNASSDYKRNLARVLTGRALQEAAAA